MAMAQISHNNGSGSLPNADAATMGARARTLMIISGLTTVIAIAAVVTVIGYRMLNNSGAGISAIAGDGIVALPKGARVISTVASGGRVAVLIEIDGATELRTFDIKTLKPIGRLQFATEP
jgi:carbon starvation protein CstA